MQSGQYINAVTSQYGSKYSSNLLSDGTSCPYISLTEPKRRSILIYPLFSNSSMNLKKYAWSQ